jgi:mono/diheme cytochrome c family protein
MRRALRVAAALFVLAATLVAGLVAYVRLRGPSRLRFPDTPSPDIHASSDPAIIERGRVLVQGTAHCSSCHGGYERLHPEALRSDVALVGGLPLVPPFGTFYPPNITPDGATGIGAWSDAEIARVVRTGVRRDGTLSVFMKLSVGPMSDADLTAVVSYLRAAAPVAHAVPPSEPGFIALAMVTFMSLPPDPSDGLADVPGGAEPSIERGDYLVHGPAVCVNCHSPTDPSNPLALAPGRELSGSDPMPSELDSTMEFVAPNLTCDPHGVTGRLGEDEFVARFASGTRGYTASIMPWECFSRISEGDVRSIYRYLHSVPPAARDVGPSYRPVGSFAAPP